MNNTQKNWDPEVKKFFLRILSSVSVGAAWIIALIMIGIYYELAFIDGRPIIHNILFYTGVIVTGFLLIRYLIRLWKNG